MKKRHRCADQDRRNLRFPRLVARLEMYHWSSYHVVVCPCHRENYCTGIGCWTQITNLHKTVGRRSFFLELEPGLFLDVIINPSSSSFGACRWRSRSRECAPGSSVLCLLEPWCKTEVERSAFTGWRQTCVRSTSFLHQGSSPFSARCVSDDLDAASSSWECAICMFGEHGSDPLTCPPEPRGQTAWSSTGYRVELCTVVWEMCHINLY